MYEVGDSNSSLLTFINYFSTIKMEKTIRDTRKLVIEQMLFGININDNSLILEPSAGSGNLVEGILRKNKNVTIHCAELNKELRNTLIDKGFVVIGNDFLNINPNPIYDYVIACPTYKNNVDIIHIMHMFDFLKNGGTLISLTYPLWIMNNGENQTKFRKWLEDKNYTMKMLIDNSFVENYKTQPSIKLIIKK